MPVQSKKNSPFEPISKCRICRFEKLTSFLDMGNMPLVNSFFKTKKEKAPVFPVRVFFCPNCYLIQLSGIVDPDLLFSDYLYHSSISNTFREHCSKLARETADRFPHLKNVRVLDIGSNDGCLLRAFAHEGFQVIGVEPSQKLVFEAKKNGIPTLADYWGPKTVQTILKSGKVGVITATSVLAQVGDIHAFVQNCQRVLADDGVMIAEIHYAANLIQKNEFDTIYHEHVSYFLLKPLLRLFAEHDLKIIDASSSVLHADALRIIIVHAKNSLAVQPSVAMLLVQEEKNGLYLPATYLRYQKSVEKTRQQTLEFLKKQKNLGKKVVGFAAAAKACVLLNYFGINSDLISFVVDQTPQKQGKFIANTGIKVADFDALKKQPIDFLVIFSWNYANEIMQKTAFLSKTGTRFVLLVPSLRIARGA